MRTTRPPLVRNPLDFDRLGGELGYCRTGARAGVAAAGPDFDEEACLSGEYGTGTVVFDSANLRGTSVAERESIPDEWPARWRKQFVHARELGDILLELQTEECHSIHFVSPSHVVPQMAAGILDATQRGLTVPIVYNSNAYDAPDILALLEGVVDVYVAKVRFPRAP